MRSGSSTRSWAFCRPRGPSAGSTKTITCPVGLVPTNCEVPAKLGHCGGNGGPRRGPGCVFLRAWWVFLASCCIRSSLVLSAQLDEDTAVHFGGLDRSHEAIVKMEATPRECTHV